MLVDTIIEARWVIPIIPKNTTLDNHAVVVDAGRIVDVLPIEEARERYESREERISLPESVVLPGLVNLHSHAAMNLVRGLGADLPLMDWLTTAIWPVEGKLMSHEFVHDGAYLAGLEMAQGGVTCTSDHYFFPEAAAEGLRKAGLRCAVSGIVIGFPSAWAQNDTQYLEKSEALFKSLEGDAFVRGTIGPHAPYTVNDASLKACALLSEKYNVPIHMHINETQVEVDNSLKEFGVRPLERLRQLGLVNERLIAVHNVQANEDELRLLAEAGSSMCHCPCSNLKLASGFAPVAQAMNLGVNLGIGTDGAASNDKLDLLGETRLAAMLAKAVANDTTQAKVYDMLEAATLGGARALHWDNEIGSIEKLKAADLIAVYLGGVNTIPVANAAAQLLYAADRDNVTHTWVAGQLIANTQQNTPHSNKKTMETMKTFALKWQNRRG